MIKLTDDDLAGAIFRAVRLVQRQFLDPPLGPKEKPQPL